MPRLCPLRPHELRARQGPHAHAAGQLGCPPAQALATGRRAGASGATAATGLKYLFHKTENRSLSLRAGAAFRYEAYEAAALGDLDDPAIDFGIEHSREFSEFLSLQSDVTYVPAFDEFSDYLLTQETALVVPLGKKSPWKLSSGLSNSYVSSPAPGNKGLDLKYYLRLTYSWE